MTKILWDMHRWETERALDNLGDYFEMIEGQFKILREKEHKQISPNPPVPSEEDEGESDSEWNAEKSAFEQRYEHDFPLMIRYSFVVQLYILLETRLKAACDEISRRSSLELKEKEKKPLVSPRESYASLKLELKESDFKGTPIERATTFLRKVANVPVKENASWQWLADLQKVRNCIVHTNGQIGISNDGAHLKKLCKRNIGLSAEGRDLMIEPRYCKKSLEMIKSFFKVIFDSAHFGSAMLFVEEP